MGLSVAPQVVLRARLLPPASILVEEREQVGWGPLPAPLAASAGQKQPFWKVDNLIFFWDPTPKIELIVCLFSMILW